jgi:DNA invertase Pin-like site-specific DNA recombinase
MSHKGSLQRTLDLFEVTLTIPTPASELTPVAVRPPALASLSDKQLAQQLGQLVEEVQRRLERKGTRPELEAAVQQARLSLDRLGPRPAKQTRSSRSAKPALTLQEGQRKAVRAALVAGVAPTQVARHFGLPLAAVRRVLEKTG